MNSAAFLLAINASIGLSFAIAFLALSSRTGVRLARWCAAGFLSATGTVAVEACAALIPSARLTSALSFGLLMLALATITIGLAEHYRRSRAVPVVTGLLVVSVALNALVVFDLPRGGWEQAVGYQGPFAAIFAIACGIVLTGSRRRFPDLALAAVLAAAALHYVGKAVLGGLAGSGPGVRDYIVSPYAFYSQTAASILSMLLGLALVGVVVNEAVAESRQRLQRDELSGLLNRAAFMEAIPGAVKRSRTALSTLVICDLDRFKSINDRFGHAAGDAVIRAFGANLRAYFGETALCGRMGGEEFCIFLPDCGPAAARTHLDALRALTQCNRYGLVPEGVTVTASFGVAFTGTTEPFEAALRRADLALYDAKAAGRDCYRFSGPYGSV
jgi:diguanylate cyclase (GGDEF)-like protein